MDILLQEFVTITPINLYRPSTKEGKKAKTDYFRERPFFESGGAKWDDSPLNKSKVGDWFAFVQQSNGKDCIEWFQIIRVESYEHRPNYWDIPQHQRRNVLYLSSKIRESSFSEWKRQKKYRNGFFLRGTIRTSLVFS